MEFKHTKRGVFEVQKENVICNTHTHKIMERNVESKHTLEGLFLKNLIMDLEAVRDVCKRKKRVLVRVLYDCGRPLI